MSKASRKFFGMIPALAGLFRPDAAAISFLSYLVGLLLSGRSLHSADFGMAALITFISTNFIYSYNCLVDRHEDAVGHPERPLPSGRLQPRVAGIYCFLLLILALIYPFFYAESQTALFLLLLLPALGLLYSAPPSRLRRFPLPAILIICSGLVTPLSLGLLQGTPLRAVLPITAGVFLFCLATVPLKSLEEVDEARQTGRANLYIGTGRKLFLFSALGLLFSIIWALLMLSGAMKIYLSLLSSLSIVSVARYSRKEEPGGLYRSIIRMVILLGLGLAFFSL